MRRDGSDENVAKYKRLKNPTKRVVAKVMKREAEQKLTNLEKRPNEAYKFMKTLKREGKDVRGGRCMKGRDGKLRFSEEDRGKIWKEYMEDLMNKENDWDQDVKSEVIEGPIERISQAEVSLALKGMKSRKASGLLKCPWK